MLDLDADQLLNDLDRSWGLPTSLYFEPAAHELDLKAIFRREWQYVGPASQIQNRGDVMVGQAGDLPVVVTRAEDGKLHGFVNICRHRGYRVAEADKTKCRRLVCHYHAWSYRLDGSLAAAPGSDEETDFPKDQLSLLPVSVEEWGPAILVNADPNAPSFLDSHPGVAESVTGLGLELDPAHYRLRCRKVHDVGSNWKVWYDNFVECYHCNHIHSDSFSAAYEADIDAVDTRFESRYMTNAYRPKTKPSTTHLRATNGRTLSAFPGLLFLQQDDLMILSQMRPTGPERTCQVVDYFAEAGSDPARVDEWIGLWEQTFTEDGDATVVQQEGLRTGAVARNRLVGSREAAVLFFNRLTCEAYKAHFDGGAKPSRVGAE